METDKKIVAVGLGEVLIDSGFDSKREYLGGAPANFAYHFGLCSRLAMGAGRVEVYIASAIGEDGAGEPDERGRRLLHKLDELVEANLRQSKLDVNIHTNFGKIKGVPTGLAKKTLRSDGSNDYEIEEAAFDYIEWTDSLKALAQRTDVVYYGTLAQRKESRYAIGRFLDEMIESERNPERATYRIFDVNLRKDFTLDVIRDSFYKCNILKLSDEEASTTFEALSGFRLEGDAGAFCTALLERFDFLKMIILTEGKRGNRIFIRNLVSNYVIREQSSIKFLDAIGAGDAFTAAFCAKFFADESVWTGRDSAMPNVWNAQLFASRVAEYVCSDESATPVYPASPDDYFLSGIK